MEVVSGLTLRSIFLHNDNWLRFLTSNHRLIRSAILVGVMKMLTCRTKEMGFHTYSCPICNYSVNVPHSCKSKFCSPCGKKATDNWISKNYNILPKTIWQHITFTIPEQLRDIFWMNRHLFNLFPKLAADIIKKFAAAKGILPALFVAPHTFGRDIKRNPHIHVSTTKGGLTFDMKRWSNNLYFKEAKLKTMWRYAVINMMRTQYKNGNLRLPPYLNHIKDYTAFNSWLNFLYSKKWVVHLGRYSNNHKKNIDYLGKYLKRPPIGETRIKSYDGKLVTFIYKDHKDNAWRKMTLPVMEFIGKLISHIQDKNFKGIRYYGLLANRVRGTLLPLAHKLLNSAADLSKKTFRSWRQLICSTFGHDPLICPKCHVEMKLTETTFAKKLSIADMMQVIKNKN